MLDLKMLIRQSAGRIVRHAMRFPRFTRSYPINHFNIILMYHRVLDSPPEGFHESALHVSAETFEMHLCEAARVFRMVSLEKLIRPGSHESAKMPLCAVTFDDGWDDTYRVAFPILRKHNVPATVFVPSNLIENGSGFWFEGLVNLANKTVENGTISTFLQYFHRLVADWNPTALSPESLSDLISRLKELPGERLPSLVSKAYTELGFALGTTSPTIGWEDMREMSNQGISFGSHGSNHLILTTLTSTLKRQEIFSSLKTMRSKGIKLIPVFSFPNGNWDAESVKYLKDAGYLAAVTTRLGFNTSATCCFLLNRIGLHEYISRTPDLFWFCVLQSILAGPKSLRRKDGQLSCRPQSFS